MKPGRFEVVVLLLFAAIAGYQLFIPPRIDAADNGDFSRFLYPAGLYGLLVLLAAIVVFVSTLTQATFDTRYSITFASAFDMNLILAVAGLVWWSRRRLGKAGNDHGAHN